MKIAIDCSKAVNERAGVARYTKNLVYHMIRLLPDDHFSLYFNFVRKCQEKKLRILDLIGNNKNVSYKIYPLPGFLKERLFFSPFSLSQYWIADSNIAHATEFLSFDNGLKIPQILTVHDLTMIKFPGQRGEKVSLRHGLMLKKACENADMIISISHSTKEDIKKYFSIDDEKIRVIYLAADAIYKKVNQALAKDILRKKYKIVFPYILFVSTLEPRKNLENLLKAFDKFSSSPEGKNYCLILAGKMGWNTKSIENTYGNMVNKHKVKFMGFVPDEDLVYLYNCASLLCYPSIYEGFGIPILEAMSCGCPVLTSDISSMPEVGGDAVYYAQPSDYLSIYQGMKKVICDKILSRKMISKGLIQAKKFSWIEFVRQTHKVYEEVLKNVQGKN